MRQKTASSISSPCAQMACSAEAADSRWDDSEVLEEELGNAACYAAVLEAERRLVAAAGGPIAAAVVVAPIDQVADPIAGLEERCTADAAGTGLEEDIAVEGMERRNTAAAVLDSLARVLAQGSLAVDGTSAGRRRIL